MTRPLLVVTIAYILGILLGREFFDINILWAGGIGAGLLLLLFFLYPKRGAAIFTVVLFVVLGCLAWNFSMSA